MDGRMKRSTLAFILKHSCGVRVLPPVTFHWREWCLMLQHHLQKQLTHAHSRLCEWGIFILFVQCSWWKNILGSCYKWALKSIRLMLNVESLRSHGLLCIVASLLQKATTHLAFSSVNCTQAAGKQPTCYSRWSRNEHLFTHRLSNRDQDMFSDMQKQHHSNQLFLS